MKIYTFLLGMSNVDYRLSFFFLARCNQYCCAYLQETDDLTEAHAACFAVWNGFPALFPLRIKIIQCGVVENR